MKTAHHKITEILLSMSINMPDYDTLVNVIGIAGSSGSCSGTSENCCCCFCIVSIKDFTSCLARRILAGS
jgi:hypothetical protein